MSFRSIYEGRCNRCHGQIFIGQTISGTPEEGYYHDGRCPQPMAVEHDLEKRRDQRRQARAARGATP